MFVKGNYFMENRRDILYIVMPAYNEEDNIENVVKEWYPILTDKCKDSRLVIADSGSNDRTHELLIDLKRSYSQLDVLEYTAKQHGPKLIALYKYAIDKGADFIFQTDSDGQTSPDEFEVFWEKRCDYDAILGNRTMRGDGRARELVEKVVVLLLRIYFGVNVPDANAPFRLMKSSVLAKYMDIFEESYNLPNIMITTFLTYYQDKVLFLPISFKPRCRGKNSINLRKIFIIGCKAIKDFGIFKKKMKNDG